MNNKRLEEIIQYSFKDSNLLKTALNHSSYCMENGLGNEHSNQRLEFLGDAYFDAIISTELYKRTHSDEGRLSKTRAAIVCERSLAAVADRLKVGEYLNLGKGEDIAGGRNKKSIKADAMEALIGAIFLDGGYDAVEAFVLREFAGAIEDALQGKIMSDYKTYVQELFQKKSKNVKISYVVDREEGPDHDKTFYVHLVCNGIVYGSGDGKTKKEAEQKAAKATLEGGNI